MPVHIHAELKALTTHDIQAAILDENENALRDLLIERFDEAEKKDIIIRDFYYAPYVACSNEPFDMFSCAGLKNLFEMHGFSVSQKIVGFDEFDLEYGVMTVSKDDFIFEMRWEHGMHDSLIADFVDTKTAKILKV